MITLLIIVECDNALCRESKDSAFEGPLESWGTKHKLVTNIWLSIS